MKDLTFAQALEDRAKAINALQRIADETICYETRGMAHRILDEILNHDK